MPKVHTYIRDGQVGQCEFVVGLHVLEDQNVVINGNGCCGHRTIGGLQASSYKCVGAWVRAGAWVRGCVGAWVRACAGVCVYVCVRVRVCACACVCACVRVHQSH